MKERTTTEESKCDIESLTTQYLYNCSSYVLLHICKCSLKTHFNVELAIKLSESYNKNNINVDFIVW